MAGAIRNYVKWHRGYDDPTSALSRRLEVVRRRLGHALDAIPGEEAPPTASDQALGEDPTPLAGMPAFDHFNCAAHLQPTTYLRPQDAYTRYTVWIRPPRRALP